MRRTRVAVWSAVSVLLGASALCLLAARATPAPWHALGVALLAAACLGVAIASLGVEREDGGAGRGNSTIAVCGHLLREASVPVGVGLVVLVLAGAWYRQSGYRLDALESMGSDLLIAWKQLDRASSIPAAEILLVGDSACLMGIDAVAAGEALAARVESLCSLAWVGPAGYAELLSAYLERHEGPVDIVVLLSTVALDRKPEWREFETLGAVAAAPPAPSRLVGGAPAMLRHLLEPVFYEPLPSSYGQYFGGRHGFVADIARHRGTTVDPAKGLDYTTLEDFLARHPPGSAVSRAAPGVRVSDEFGRAAARFSARLDDYPRARLWFGIMPRAGARLSAAARAQWAGRVRGAARALSIGPERVLPLPATRPPSHFSTKTHLHRWGRELYTRDFVEVVREAIPKPGSS